MTQRATALFTASILIALATTTYLLVHNQSPVQQTVNSLDLACGFTDDFANFIKTNGYSSWNFDRTDLPCAAYGGKASSDDKVVKTPIIFVHGNGDIGFGRGAVDGHLPQQTGARSLFTFFGSQGYTKAELYTTTWGPGSLLLAQFNNHKKSYVLQMRAFVEAVLAYTGAAQVSIISHSMGVTIARKIVKGGAAVDHKEGNYYVGESLGSRVKAFIGIAGGNWGLNTCIVGNLVPTCHTVDGYYPGATIISGPSKFLKDLNNNGGPEGKKVYSVWSIFDEFLMDQCLVWGKVTSRIPGQTSQIAKTALKWSHITLRDEIGPEILDWL